MSKCIKIAALTAATLAYATAVQADSMGDLQLAAIAKKSGKCTPQQKALLKRYGH